MKKIKDLIQVPFIETVIKIDETYTYNKQEIKKRYFDPFVLTKEISIGLEILIRKLSKKQSGGIIIKGNYGSGKSHLLGYILSICENKELFFHLSRISDKIKPYQTLFFPGEILTVPIPLHHYSNQNSIEDAVIDSVYKKISFQSPDLPKTFSDKILNDFKNNFSQELVNEFHQKYHQLSPQEQAKQIKLFFKEKNISFSPLVSRNDFFQILSGYIDQYFPGGLLLLMDEVSEFLRSRSEIDTNSEDIRFLQFLGEWALSYPCMTILSMQEDIQETSRVSEVSLNKIRDRYQNRITLSATHIKELLKERLSKKKINAKETIHQIFLQYKEYFPNWKVSFDDFYTIYPIHPATIYYLESISNIFSKSRGIIEFFYTVLTSKDYENKLPFLEQPCNTLITPDKIFNHFKDKIQENYTTNFFIDTIYHTFEKDIQSIFQDSDDQESETQTAYAIIKILILNTISPTLKKLSLKKLTELTGKGISSFDSELNLDYIQHILKKMMLSFQFIKKVPHPGPGNDIYYITLEKSIMEQFEEEVKKNQSRIVNIEKKVIAQLLKKCIKERFPAKEFYKNISIRNIVWQETYRKTALYFAMPQNLSNEDIQAFCRSIEKGEYELLIVIGFPVPGCENYHLLQEKLTAQSIRAQQSILYWQPTVIEDHDLRTLCFWFAYQTTYQHMEINDPNFFGNQQQEIQQKLFSLEEESTNKLLSHFFPPYITRQDTKGIFGESARIIPDLQQVLKKTADIVFNQIYPEHKKIKPILTEPGMETLSEIIKYINQYHTIDRIQIQSDTFSNIIKNLVEKIPLLKFSQKEILLNPNPGKSPFLRELLKYIEMETPGYQELYYAFRNSIYGITQSQLALVLNLLYLSGYIQFYYKNNTEIKPENINLSAIQSLEKITPGEKTSEKFMAEYKKLSPLIGAIKESQLHLRGQEQAWQDLIQYKEENEQKISEKIKLLEYHAGIPPFSIDSFSKMANALTELDQILQSIKKSLDSNEGLNRVLDNIPGQEELSLLIIHYENAQPITSPMLQQTEFIYNYISYPDITPILEKSDHLLNSYNELINLCDEFKNNFHTQIFDPLFNQFENFHQLYKKEYKTYHQDFYPEDYYQGLKSLKSTSQYQILNHLSQIELISVKNDFIKIDNNINGILEYHCKRDLESELKSKPYCSCSSNLNHIRRDRQIPITEIDDTIKKGILEYLIKIKSKEYYYKLHQYKMNALNTNETDKSLLIDFFLNIDTETFPSITELRQKINPHSISIINQALSGNIKIVKRSLDSLKESLYGRKYKVSHLKQIFRDWLKEEDFPEGEIYIEIESEAQQEKKTQRIQQQLPPQFIAKIRQFFPEYPINEAVTQFIQQYLDFIFKKFNLQPIHLTEIDTNLLIPSEEIQNLIKQVPEKTDLSQFLNKETITAINNHLKYNQLDEKTIFSLFSNLIFFKNMQRKIIQEIYFRLNTFNENDYINLFKNQSDESILARGLLEQNQLKKTEFHFDSRFNHFIKQAKQILHAYLYLKQIELINKKELILPQDFISHFEKPLHEKINKTTNFFINHLRDWEEEQYFISSPLRKLKTSSKIILIDCLRIDFYEGLKSYIIENYDLLIEKEEFYISLLPSNTETFYQFLEKEDIPVHKSVERDYNQHKFHESFLNSKEPVNIYSISFLDEKIHVDKGSLIQIFQEFIYRINEILAPLIKKIQSGDIFYLTADHGFIEKTQYQYKDTPRYTHGGASIYERLVPLIKFKKR